MSALFRKIIFGSVLMLTVLATGAWQNNLAVLASSQKANTIEPPLYPGLTWSQLGSAKQNIRININGDSFSVSGERFEAQEQFVSSVPLPEDLTNYYSTTELAKSGWASYDAANDSDGVHNIFYHEAGRYLSVEYLKCQSDAAMTCVAVWMSEPVQNQATAAGTVNTPENVAPAVTSTFSKTSPVDGATGVNASSVTLKWASYSSAQKYAFCYQTGSECAAGSSGWTSTYDTNSPALSLTTNKTYYWQVRALTCGTCTPKKWVYANSGDNWSFQTQTSSVAIVGNVGVAGGTVSYVDGTAKKVTADSEGHYKIIVPYNWSGTITPSKSGYLFSPVSVTFSKLTSQTIQNFTAIVAYTISGNAGISGAKLSYTDGTPKTVIADSNGNYSIVVPAGWSGTVTPSKTSYSFFPASRTYPSLSANQAAQNYTATYIVYTISGDAGVGGVVLTYTVDGVLRSVMSDESGNYSITVPYQWSGTVTPLRACYTFTPVNKVYTTLLANQSGQTYSAAFSGSGCGAGVGIFDDGDAHWTYTGSWHNYSGSGPYNSTLHYTSTVGNWAWFPFNGTQFTLSYTQYPNRGSFEVYVDGNKLTTINANGIVAWRKTYTSPIFLSGTHVVQLKNIGGSGKVMDVDAIQILTTAAPGAGIYDDGYFNWRYTGKWNNYAGSGPYNSTLHYTLTAGNSAWFTFTGTQFILSYTQYANRGSFEVYVDGSKVTTINANGTTQWQKMYVSQTFSAGIHEVQLKNIAGSGNVTDVDAIQILTAPAPGAGTYDDNSANWFYSGTWLSYSGADPHNGTLHYTLTVGASASFAFNGTGFTFTYTQYPNRGSFEMYVDGTKVTTINANGTVQWQKTYPSPTFTAGTHVVQIKNIGLTGTVIDVDAITIN